MPLLSNLVALAVVSVAITPAAAAKSICPPLGPVLPAPKAPSKHATVEKSTKLLTSGLEEKASDLLNYSALSIGFKSLHEKEKLFSFHHTPPNMGDIGTEKIDENTIYRVGSMSKMMPALAALQSKKINLNDSMLEYPPELGSDNEGVDANIWENITVRSLANHLSGLFTDSMF